MCSKKKRAHFTKGNENKRLYPVLLFPEDTENPVNNLDVVNFTDLCFVSVSKPRKTYKIFTYFSSEGTTGKPNSISSLLKVASTFKY